MKTLLSLIVFGLLCLARESNAQVTQIVVTAVIKLSSGLSFTNSVNNSNQNILAAATNSMTKFNLIGQSTDPKGVQTTNLAHFIIEFNKQEFNLKKNAYDFQIPAEIAAKMSKFTEAQKDQLRAISDSVQP